MDSYFIMDTILKKLHIDETYTKPVPKEKVFTKVKDQIPPRKHFNYMADLLFLPETKQGYKYLLVMVDLYTDKFDIEPMKTKESEDALSAMKTIFKRPYLKKPEASIQTDGGTEFKDVFHKFLYNENIFHKVTFPDRHSQMSSVENLNKTLGRLINGYLNTIEIETSKTYCEWDTGELLDTIRTELNKYRSKKNKPTKQDLIFRADKEPKYKVGDIVYRKLETPMNVLGHKESTKQFRMGDLRFDVKQPRKITHVFYYSGKIPYRYQLESIDNVSFTEAQLKPAKGETESKYVVEKIIGRKVEKKKNYYLVKWKNYKKDESTWEPEEKLRTDGLGQMIEDYDKTRNSKK